jgi:hypothetical protein
VGAAGSGEHAVEQDVDDLLRGERGAVAHARVRGGEGEQAQQAGQLAGRDAEPVGVGADHLHDGSVQGLVERAGVLVPGARPAARVRAEGVEQGEHPRQPLLQRGHHRDEPVAQRSGGVDRAERGQQRAGVQRGSDHRPEQGLLVREDAEDRALGHAGGLRDLPGADPRAVPQHQRQRGVDQRCPPLVGGQSPAPVGAG